VVSWSVSAAVCRPTACAAAITRAGGSVPSEWSECRCRSLGPRNRGIRSAADETTIPRAYRRRGGTRVHRSRSGNSQEHCRRVPHVLRLLGILVTVAAAIATAVVTWPQFFRLEQTFPFAQIVSCALSSSWCSGLVFVLGLLLPSPARCARSRARSRSSPCSGPRERRHPARAGWEPAACRRRRTPASA
jgi:hypothetical protein